MVSKSNVIVTDTKCICGNGDTINVQRNYFENKCPYCNKEGTLQVETESNVELSNNNFDDEENTENNTVDNDSPSLKIVCKNCTSEFCGQDGSDLGGGTRGSLTYVNPNEITDDNKEETSTTEENETTYMSGWEGLCDLLKPLDGQAMMVQRGDYVIVKKIEMRQTAKLWAYEGINVVDDSVKITDYTPEIYNTFIIKWGESFENELEFTINNHKKLFGERKVVIEAKKISVVDEESDEDSKNNDDDKSNESDGGLLGSNDEDLSNLDSSNLDSNDVENLNSDSSSSSDKEIPKTEEVPITTKKEAIQFGLTQVGKARRENGHTIELKVIGSSKWKMGEWCHVRLPSFNEDSYMFISKCGFDSSPDSEYLNSLTLVDYPPSLGKPDKNSQKEEESSEEKDSDSSSDSSDADESNKDKNNDETDNNDND